VRHALSVGPVVGSLRNLEAHLTITVQTNVGEGAYRLVDGKLAPVSADSRELRVEIGEVSDSKHGIVRVVDTRDDVTCAEGDLLSLGEIVGDVSVQLHRTDVLNWVHLLGHILCAVEEVEIELVALFYRDDLDTELPLGEAASLDGIVEITSVEVWVLAVDLQSLVPYETVASNGGVQWNLT